MLLIGDTATGKSETLEALRVVGEERIRELRIIADDMGSLEVGADGRVLGYGTEIGAFVRLDDLQQGYAFGQIDRAIIMSPNKVNARVVLPVTTLEDVLRGYPVDFLLYANNYEAVDDEHPVVERLTDEAAALAVFREGAAMSQGHDHGDGADAQLLRQPVRRGAAPRSSTRRWPRATFAAAFEAGVFVGQLRTQLGLPGAESAGPRAAAEALLELIAGASSPASRETAEQERDVMATLYESNETAWKLISRGKVRDVYAYAPNEMLIVTSDRLSAFDVILPTPIPDKGVVLTQISNFWFAQDRARIIANHIVDPDPFSTDAERKHLAGRSVVVHKAEALPVEAIVRGYLTGSGRKDYEKTGTVCGIPLPEGLVEASRLPEPLFTPSTKAEIGDHDENISFDKTVDLIGGELAEKVRDVALELYSFGAGLRAGARHHHRRHQVRVRHARRRADPHRRGADAGLVALLAGRRLRGRQEPAELRQAVRARLPRDARLGQDGARARAAAARWRRRPPRSTWRRGAA